MRHAGRLKSEPPPPRAIHPLNRQPRQWTPAGSDALLLGHGRLPRAAEFARGRLDPLPRRHLGAWETVTSYVLGSALLGACALDDDQVWAVLKA